MRVDAAEEYSNLRLKVSGLWKYVKNEVKSIENSS